MKIKFGPAGQCQQATADGIKNTISLIDYLHTKGVDVFEYQCGRGVRISEEKSIQIAKKAKECKIEITLHAPYYISLASKEEEKRENSVNYIYESAVAVNNMGGNRIVVHPGGLGGKSREEATLIAMGTLKKAQNRLDSEGLSNVIICPETMGKINQLGTLEEIVQFCTIDERLLPCVDFGHLNSRTNGSLRTVADFENVFNIIENIIGIDRLKIMHVHFSKIEYTKGGEKRHLTFEDDVYGPDYQPFLEAVYKRALTPTVICESAGTQTNDALIMSNYYKSLKG